jgi:hypothetical protein
MAALPFAGKSLFPEADRAAVTGEKAGMSISSARIASTRSFTFNINASSKRSGAATEKEIIDMAKTAKI